MRRLLGLLASGVSSACLALAAATDVSPSSVPVHSAAGATASASAPAPTATATGKRTLTTARAKPIGTRSRYVPERFAGRAGNYYRLIWGVDDLTVRWAESGEVIRFSYRVLDPNKARALNDEKNEPLLIDPRARVQLVVPHMDKVGQLRQSATPEAGRAYWMAFSNKGRPVRRGDHVVVQIGPFRADGLVVD